MTTRTQPDSPPRHAHADVHTRLVAWLAGRARTAHSGMFGLARHAGWYDGLPGRLAQPLYRRIAEDVAAAGLPDGAVVLDVGTGPGRVPLLVAERCPALLVEGIDPSPQMIDRAEKRSTAAGPARSRVSYRVADVAALPYADDSIDLVVSSLSLHHWADVPAGLSEIRRVLRPGGSAWIYDVRPVLRRVVDKAQRGGVDVRLEPLRRPDPGRHGRARLLTAAARRLVCRLTVRA